MRNELETHKVFCKYCRGELGGQEEFFQSHLECENSFDYIERKDNQYFKSYWWEYYIDKFMKDEEIREKLQFVDFEDVQLEHVHRLRQKYMNLFELSKEPYYNEIIGSFLIKSGFVDDFDMDGIQCLNNEWLSKVNFIKQLYNLKLHPFVEYILSEVCADRQNDGELFSYLIFMEYYYPQARKFITDRLPKHKNNKKLRKRTKKVKRITQTEKKLRKNFTNGPHLNFKGKLWDMPIIKDIMYQCYEIRDELEEDEEYGSNEFWMVHLVLFIYDLLRMKPEHPIIAYIYEEAKKETKYNYKNWLKIIERIFDMIEEERLEKVQRDIRNRIERKIREYEKFKKEQYEKLPDEDFKEFQEFFSRFKLSKYEKLENKDLFFLDELDLMDSPIEIDYLPKSIGKLQNLKRLYVEWNELTEIPEELGEIKGLVELNLLGNYIEEFPSCIRKLTSLRTLLIGKNNFTDVKDIFSNLIYLERLDVSESNISKLPGSIGKLRLLRELNIENNELTEIPEEIKELQLLRTLKVNNNQITEIPFWIQEMYYEDLDLTDNPIEEIDEKLMALNSCLQLNGHVRMQFLLDESRNEK